MQRNPFVSGGGGAHRHSALVLRCGGQLVVDSRRVHPGSAEHRVPRGHRGGNATWTNSMLYTNFNF
jgi:hypothetical protein